MNERILIIDDDEASVEIVSYALEEAGYETASAADAQEAENQVSEFDPDLIILDLKLPGKPGLDLFRSIRSQADIPTIVLSAKTDEVDKVLAFELGADDYITKPFSPRELVSRVRARLRERGRRPTNRQANVLEVGDLRINYESYEVSFKGNLLTLTNSEFQILALLAKHPGKVFSRKSILNSLRHGGFKGDERTIDVHIHNLREKFEQDPQKPEYLLTVRSHGYKLLGSKRS